MLNEKCFPVENHQCLCRHGQAFALQPTSHIFQGQVHINHFKKKKYSWLVKKEKKVKMKRNV